MVRQDSAKVPPPVRFWASPPIVLLVAAFIGAAIAGPGYAIHQLDAASREQVGLADARAQLDGALAAQLAEETALRGYVSTRDAVFLDGEEPAGREFERHIAALDERLREAGLAPAAATVRGITAAHATWSRDVKRPLLASPGGANANYLQVYGKLLTDRMGGDAEVLRGTIARESAAVEASLERRINATVALSTGAVTVFAIAALAYALSRASTVSRLARERALVDALQRTLRVTGERLPRTEIGSVYASATVEALVGGDLLDMWRTSADVGWFLVADVSGKGIPAARHSAFAQYALRALVAEHDDPGFVLERFNRLFFATFDDPGLFVVVFLGRFEASTATLRYAGAGHGTAFVRRAGGIEHLAPTGALIGVMADERYPTATLTLMTGDLVLAATDGLTEARDEAGELFGDERVAELLQAGPDDAQAVCDLLVRAAEQHSSHGVQDDLAILALRVVQDDEPAAGAPNALGPRRAAR